MMRFIDISGEQIQTKLDRALGNFLGNPSSISRAWTSEQCP